MSAKEIDLADEIVSIISKFGIEDRVNSLNIIRKKLWEISPFKSEPVDCVEWVNVDGVKANDYNPNSVAPPEMELLRHSINHDGYTQPVVTWLDGDKREVIDGFHRTRVCKELSDVKARVHGYLPVVTIKDDCKDKTDRIASTIRHNRARGKHNVTAMSDIVTELKNRNWKNARISRELGMDEDEVLRLCQITGLESLFGNEDFSSSWTIGEEGDEFKYLTDEDINEENKGKTANTSDSDRIFHTYDKWECHKCGFYATNVEGKTKGECESEYLNILGDKDVFSDALEYIISNWKNSCEHYLTNKAMNRIAWLGQAAVCLKSGVPAKFSSGWNLLSGTQQKSADMVALKYLNIWLSSNNMSEVSMDDAMSTGRQLSIY